MTEEMLSRCDQEGIDAYLEDTNPANDGFCQKFGFHSQGPLSLPSGAPLVTGMWRDPQP